MTLAEILKQNGVAEDTIRTIQNDMKTAKLFTTGEENADIRLGKLKGEHESVRQQLEAAQQKIAALEADKAEHSGSQEKMDEMHRQLEAAQAALQKSRMDAAIHIALMRGGASDIDYMTWVLQQKGDALTLDDKGNIDGWENTLASTRTSLKPAARRTSSRTVCRIRRDTRRSAGARFSRNHTQSGRRFSRRTRKPSARRWRRRNDTILLTLTKWHRPFS